ncbi:MAG: ATP-dependent DNA helicase UvrD2 [bacterium]|nr:ATP-dependent DNA helicase UvrD2 [bacterium]
MAPGAVTPLEGTDRVRVDAEVLAVESLLEQTVEELHRAWVTRRPITVELVVEAEKLRRPVVERSQPWRLGPGYTLLRERLHFLVWANNWDCRHERPIWWWSTKAAALGATIGGPADILLADGTPAWVDGGPRAPLPLAIVHAESVEAGWLRLARDAEGIGEGLATDQAAAVAHGGGPARIVAPAGSGKTRTLNARLLHLADGRGIEPRLITAVAYNNRAAAEMRNRLERDDLHIRTIHSLGWAVIRDVHPDAALVDERGVRARLRRMIPRKPRLNTDIVGPYIEALSDVRIALRDPHEVEESRDDVPDLPRVLVDYRSALDNRNEYDYDEQVYGAIELLLRDPDLRRRWQRRCRHLLVDEFQDLTPAYVLLLRLLASPRLTVFGVGDDDQTIYGYSGADPGFLLDFDRFFPGAAPYALEVNYRSPAEVVDAAVLLLGNNRRRIPKSVRAAAGSESRSFRIAQVPDAEVVGVTTSAVSGWLDEGVPAEQVAVLARVNSALLPILAALDRAGAPLGARISRGLLDRSAMRAAVAWIRIALDPAEMWRQDLIEAVRRPARRLNRIAADLIPGDRPLSLEGLSGLARPLERRQAEYWERWVDDITRISQAASSGQTVTVLTELIEGMGLGRAAGLLDGGRTRVDRAAHSDDLVALRRTTAVYQRLGSFEEELRNLLNRHAPASMEAAKGVTLSTVHRVKGMEWDRVVVFGVDDGLLPHTLAEDVEEERRVLHVAMTRGRYRVVVVACSERPSPFVAELRGEPRSSFPAATARLEEDGRGERRDPDAQPLSGDDVEFLQELKQWRMQKARERGVPPYAVFWDRTLEQVAAARPGSGEELLRLYGFGRKKLDEYGEELLGLVKGSAAPSRAAAANAAREDRTGTGGVDGAGPVQAGPDGPDEDLLERLLEWRRIKVDERGVPPYIVLQNRTIEEIAAIRPRSERALLAVYGIGPGKLDEYGEEILELVEAAV